MRARSFAARVVSGLAGLAMASSCPATLVAQVPPAWRGANANERCALINATARRMDESSRRQLGVLVLAQEPPRQSASTASAVTSDVRARRINSDDTSPSGSDTVRRVLQVMAGAGVSVGAVLSQEEAEKAVPLQGGNRQSETVGDLLDAVFDELPDMQVGQRGGSIVLASPQAAACYASLRRPLSDVHLSGPASDVINNLARIAAGEKGPFVGGGLVGGGGDPPPGRREPELTFTLNSAGLTYLEALQEMSRQIPNMGWMVVQRRAIERQPDGTLGFSKDESRRYCSVHLLPLSMEVQIMTVLGAPRER